MLRADIHHTQYHLRHSGEMGKLYWSNTLAVLATSLALIFVPIFMYKLGYTLASILLFNAATGLAWAIAVWPTAHCIGRYGANRTMALANILNVIYFGLLALLPHHRELFWPLAIINGVESALYLTAFRANFSKARSSHSAGRQVGVLQALQLSAHAIAPLAGGLIATTVGITSTFLIVIGIYVVATLPLLLGAEVTRHRPPRWNLVDWHVIAPTLIGGGCYTINTLNEQVVWPLFVFLIVKTYANVGVLTSLGMTVSIIVSFYVGNREAKMGEERYLKRGTSLVAASNTFRVLAQNGFQVAGLNLLNGVAYATYATPYFSRYYRRADEQPRLEFVSAMQMVSGATVAAFMLVLYLLSLVLSTPAVLACGITITVLCTLGIRKI